MISECSQLGLLLSFIGAVSLGISTQFGLGVGYGGLVAFKYYFWKLLNAFGWITLAVGFAVQLNDFKTLGICF